MVKWWLAKIKRWTFLSSYLKTQREWNGMNGWQALFHNIILVFESYVAYNHSLRVYPGVLSTDSWSLPYNLYGKD